MCDEEEALYLEGSDGRIAFTDYGRRELTPYFAKASIDLLSIRTKEQYLAARQAAAPFFRSHLLERVEKGPKTLERRALIAIATGDDEAFERLLSQLRTREKLTVI